MDNGCLVESRRSQALRWRTLKNPTNLLADFSLSLPMAGDRPCLCTIWTCDDLLQPPQIPNGPSSSASRRREWPATLRRTAAAAQNASPMSHQETD